MTRTLIRFSRVLAALLALPMAAQQDAVSKDEKELLELLNTPLNLVVTGATKRAQKLIEAPMAIEVLKAKDLETQGIYRIQDALKLMTSVDIIENDTGYSTVGMRGILQEGQPRIVQILIDGVPFYMPAIGSIDINNLPLPVDMIEQIEVVRGPNSTLYGANAVGGVISITTKSATEGSHGSFRYSPADKKTHRGNAVLNWGRGHWGVTAGYGGASLGTSNYQTHLLGGYVSPTNPSKGSQVIYDENWTSASQQMQAFAKAEYHDRSSRIWFSGGSSKKMNGPEGSLPYHWQDYQVLQGGWRQSWSPRFSTELKVHRLDQGVVAGPNPVLVLAMGDPKFVEEYRWADVNTTQAVLEANWELNKSLYLVFGGDTRTTRIAPCQFQGLKDGVDVTGSGAFAILDWSPTQSTTLSLGLRAENETLGGSRTSPRLAFIWKPTSSNVFRIGYYTSTRSPQVLEKDVFASLYLGRVNLPTDPRPIYYQVLPNPEIKPEKITNYEVGYRQYLAGLTLDLTLYMMKFSQLIYQVPLPKQSLATKYVIPSQYQNLGDATNKGVELSLTYPLPHIEGLTLGFNTTFLNFVKDRHLPEDPIGNRFAYAVKSRANLWARYNRGAFSGQLSVQHLGETEAEAVVVYGYPYFEKREAITQWNLNGAYEVWNGLRLGAYIRNGAKEFTPQGATGTDRPSSFQAARREIGATLAYRY